MRPTFSPFTISSMGHTNELKILLSHFITLYTYSLSKLPYHQPLADFGQVDVRDVASATVAAMTTLAASGHRILLVADAISPQLVKNVIEKHFPQLKERLTAGRNRTQIFPVGVDPTEWDVSRSSTILSH